MKAWQGRFKESNHQLMESFNASIMYDQRLYKEDITGSKAHVIMLSTIGVLTEDEKETLLGGLTQLLLDIESGTVSFKLSDEDVHMGIERILTERLGDVAKKMHTGRSRNDQVATDMRLYVIHEVHNIKMLLKNFINTLLNISEKHTDYVLPGFTHLQKAQPILLSYHMNAYCHMFKRDFERLNDLLERVLDLPLGSGALAGTNYVSDRELMASILGFKRVSTNGLDAVSDRDFVIELQSALSIIIMHFSRLSEELILWQTEAMGYITISDAFSTGSSLMPQKKNPDACELVRGKTGRVYGNLLNILTIMKGLPLAYNKDMQEDKEGLFDSVETIKQVIEINDLMFQEIIFHKEVMLKDVKNSFLNATELADYLVAKGFPFRDAHHLIGEIVKYCMDEKIYLLDVPLDIYKSYTPLIDMDVYTVIDFKQSIKNKVSYGSTSYASVQRDIDTLKGWIETL